MDFRRQLAESSGIERPTKKFKSSTPKGVKLAAGYTDRTKGRSDEEEDDKAKRIKALEEVMKLGQIDEATFEKLRDEIVGGDISATHLVKGLDRRLLERVRRGEDVYNSLPKPEPEAPIADVDEEFDKLEEKELAPVTREKTPKKGELAQIQAESSSTGTKRSRDQILADFKAQRKAALEAKAATLDLGSKFRKIGEKKDGPRIEIDENGREILITTDENGNIKRKVRKAKTQDAAQTDLVESMKKKEILGADVAIPEALPVQQEDSESEDIFEGVGDEYDPLGGLEDDDVTSSEEEGEEKTKPISKPKESISVTSTENIESKSTKEPAATTKTAPRNYFGDKPATAEDEPQFNPLSDPTILAALRRSRDAAVVDKASVDPEEEARRKKREAMLASANRDFDDLDMGFGASRFDDADEMEAGDDVKFSEWKGTAGDDGEEGDKERGGKKRKRGPKKRKGDKDSAADVMKVLEQRKR